jgi:hypothetical protein
MPSRFYVLLEAVAVISIIATRAGGILAIPSPELVSLRAPEELGPLAVACLVRIGCANALALRDSLTQRFSAP